MDQESIVERLNAELEPLMERYFENSRSDLDAMRAAVREGDIVSLTQLGHRTKGAAYGYGMTLMGDLGLALEDAGKAGDREQCTSLVDDLADYLDRVTIEYV